MSNIKTVVVLGATNKPERYAYLAMSSLLKNGHKVIPVHPTLKDVLGIPVKANLSEIRESIDDITLYVGPDKSTAQKSDILKLKPNRIIFNPGTENPDLFQSAKDQGIEVVEACTLVMLSTGVY